MDFTIIQVSAKTFAGFRHLISKQKLSIMTDNEIITDVLANMKKFFKDNNLYILEAEVSNLNLHFHESVTPDKDVIYLCDHC